MITEEHPILEKLRSEPRWRFELIGSRFCGVFTHDSDYDFLCSVDSKEDREALNAWAKKQGFSEENVFGYGLDPKMVHLRWAAKGEHQQVDLLICFTDEAKRRLRFLHELKKAGNDVGGRLQQALKQGELWPAIWDTLRLMAIGDQGGSQVR